MTNNKGRVTDEMLVKYLLKETSEEEDAAICSWLEENQANRKLYEDFRQIWDQSKNISAYTNADEEGAWLRFNQKIANNKHKSIPFVNFRRYMRVAAVLLLLAGAGGLAIFLSVKHADNINTTAMAPVQKPDSAVLQNIVTEESKNTPAAIINENNLSAEPNVVVIRNDHKHSRKENNNRKEIAAISSTRELEKLIRNSSPCPLQICITQTVECSGHKPATTSTCSTLEPDQSGELCIKSSVAKKQNKCRMAVDEIRIEKISTGEAIVLNAHSSPATAQDVFNYISGHKQGSITAGIFNDCNTNGTHRITLANDYGSLQLQ